MNTQIREEAATWLIEFRTDETDPGMRERFTQWLRTSPEHVRAYLQLFALWEDASDYDSARKLDVESLVALARADGNVVALEPSSSRHHIRNSAPALPLTTARIAFRFRAAAAVLASVLIAAGAWFVHRQGQSFTTGLGEQRSIRLQDGSSVELNALSHIRVRFTPHERAVDLLAGQALFRVAKDKSRPFVVFSNDMRVLAVGTQFDVNRKRSGTTVTVLEGRVAILPSTPAEKGRLPLPTRSSGAEMPLELAEGEQATVTDRSPTHLHHANLVTATAWRQQQLIFDSTPLPDVAEEFNRFNARQSVVESPQLADFHVSGTFSAVDPASLSHFLHFLEAQPGIEILESEDRIIIKKK